MTGNALDSGLGNKERPNLFLVGAMKAGTTTLQRVLRSHPSIFMSPVKEPNYFSDKIFVRRFNDKERKRFEEYLAASHREDLHSAPVYSLEEYELLFRDAGEAVYRGEASPSYFHSTDAPRRLFEYAPDARIIIILREPIQRALSHYRMDVTIGKHNYSLDEAFRRELAGEIVGSGRGYLAMSLYAEALERWTEYFSQENMLVTDYDDIFTSRVNYMAILEDWLSLEKTAIKNDFPRYNSSRRPKFIQLNYLMRSLGIKGWLREVLPASLKEHGKRFFYSESHATTISDDLNQLLKDFFATDILRAKRLISELRLSKKSEGFGE